MIPSVKSSDETQISNTNPQTRLLQKLDQKIDEMNAKIDFMYNQLEILKNKKLAAKKSFSSYATLFRSFNIETSSNKQIEALSQGMRELSDSYKEATDDLLNIKKCLQESISDTKKSISEGKASKNNDEEYNHNIEILLNTLSNIKETFQKNLEMIKEFQEEAMIKIVFIRFNNLNTVTRSLDKKMRPLYEGLVNKTDSQRCQHLMEIANTAKSECRQVIKELMSDEKNSFLKEINKDWSAYLKIGKKTFDKNSATQELQTIAEKYGECISTICRIADIPIPENIEPRLNQYS